MLIIDQLPPEILSLILSSLDINNLLNYRLVNRRWKATIEFNVRIKGLTVREHEFSDRQYFELADQLMKRNHQYVTASTNFAATQFMQTILEHLKKLSVDLLNLAILRSLNGLTNLEHLEVYKLELDELFTIRSTSLKTLAVGYIYMKKLTKNLRLDTPNLSTVEFGFDYCFEALEFVHPKSVTTFSTYYYQDDFRQFENLRVCYIHYYDSMEHEPPSDFLKLFPAVHLFHCKWTFKHFVRSLLSSRDRLQRTDFKFYWRGLQIDTLEELKNYPNAGDSETFDRSKHLQLVLSKYDQLPSRVPYIRFVDYTVLNRHFNGRIDRGFFGRFKNILRLLVSEPIGDQEQFAWFVRNCEQLQKLKMINAGVDQSIYDQLPDYCPRIKKFRINEELDLSFVLRLKNMQDFKLQEVTLPFAISAACLFKKQEHYVQIEFKHNGQPGEIFFNHVTSRFEISKKSLVFKSRDELIQHIESISFD